MKRNLAIWIVLAAVLLVACAEGVSGTSIQTTAEAEPSSLPSSTPEPTPTAFLPPTATLTPDWTATPTRAPTLEPVTIPPGTAIAPILLYHHINSNGSDSRYYVEPAMFEQQMRWLYEHGYQTITVTELVRVIREGGVIPARPVIITFDDGNLDVYQNAFPVMQEYGFVGVFYIVGNRLTAQDFVTAEQLLEMVASGWEIGSHSATHANLVERHDLVKSEAYDSKSNLESALGIPINTFAYPFGRTDELVTDHIFSYGYLGAVGLGTSCTHTKNTLYYLSREEIRFEYTMEQFIALLPWQN